MKKSTKYLIISCVLLVLAIAAGFGTYFFYHKYQDLKKNPDLVTKEETQVLTDKIGALMELPKDEAPTVATVMDKEKVKDQPFFTNSINGDKVLLYVTAKKAILYRPSTNKIVEVAPIFTDTATPAPTATSKR